MGKTKKPIDYTEFNVIEFLEEEGIEYKETGKNIGQDWIGINCPFCNGPGFHGGVNTTHKIFSCFQCGTTATPPKYIKELLNFREWKDAYETYKKYKTDKKVRKTKVITRASTIKLPGGKLTKAGYKYLKSRKFDPFYLVKKYKIRDTGIVGSYKYRIIIPIFINGKPVSFTARDYTGKRDPRYKDCQIEKSIIHPKETIYNIDNCEEKMLIVEGPTDVWRLGDGAVCLFGVNFTPQQLALIKQKNLKKAVVMFDEGFNDKANKLAIELTAFVPKVFVVSLTEGDPGEMSDDEAFNLKKDVL